MAHAARAVRTPDLTAHNGAAAKDEFSLQPGEEYMSDRMRDHFKRRLEAIRDQLNESLGNTSEISAKGSMSMRDNAADMLDRSSIEVSRTIENE